MRPRLSSSSMQDYSYVVFQFYLSCNNLQVIRHEQVDLHFKVAFNMYMKGYVVIRYSLALIHSFIHSLIYLICLTPSIEGVHVQIQPLCF